MDLGFLLKGIMLGLAIAAPVGPIGILCIKRSLSHGKASGFFTGFGAATADAVYGAIAAFGLVFLSSFLIKQRVLIQSLGVIFLVYLGIKTLLEKQKKGNKTDSKSNSLIKDFLSAFILTLTNPITILSFIAIFIGIGLLNSRDNSSSLFLVLGIFFGSLIWWIFLSVTVGTLRKKFNESTLIWTNRVSGIIILVFVIFIIKEIILGT